MLGFDNKIRRQCSDRADYHVNLVKTTAVKTVTAKAAFSWKVPAFATVAA